MTVIAVRCGAPVKSFPLGFGWARLGSVTTMICFDPSATAAAPVLWVTANDSETLRRMTDACGGEAALLARMKHMPGLRRVCLPEAGPNLHHDQPEALALAIEPFLMDGSAGANRCRWTPGRLAACYDDMAGDL